MHGKEKTTPVKKSWNRERNLDAGSLVDRCRSSIRLGSNPNGPGDMLGLFRL